MPFTVRFVVRRSRLAQGRGRSALATTLVAVLLATGCQGNAQVAGPTTSTPPTASASHLPVLTATAPVPRTPTAVPTGSATRTPVPSSPPASTSSTARPSPSPIPATTVDPLAAVRHPIGDLKDNRLVAEILVGGEPASPDWQAVGFGSVWVANYLRGLVQRVDPRTNKVIAEIPVSATCMGLTVGFDSVWAPTCTIPAAIARIDAKSNKILATIELPGLPSDGEGLVGAGEGGVWIFTDDAGTLTRIDPATNAVAGSFKLPSQSYAALVGFGSIWVTSYTADAVERLDPASGRVSASIPVTPRPRFAAVGEDAVWVLGQADGDVTRIDPRANTALTIHVGVRGQGGCIAAGEGGIWVTMPGTPFVTIDPSSNAVVEMYQGQGGDCISSGFGSVWLSNRQFGTVWRISPP